MWGLVLGRSKFKRWGRMGRVAGARQRGLTVQFESERRLPGGLPVAHHHEAELAVVALDHVGVHVQLQGCRGRKGVNVGRVGEVRK